MEQNIKDILALYLTSLSCYAFYLFGINIVKEVKKLLRKLKYLKTFKSVEETVINLKNNSHDDYVILKGTAKKIFPRYGSYIDKKVIVSEGNTTYYEDFFLFLDKDILKPSCVVQPYPGTRLRSLTMKFLTESKSIWDRLGKKFLYAKSQTINDDDKLFIFGKVNRNQKDIISEFHHLVNIKPKEITGRSIEHLKYLVKERHLNKIYFQSLICVLITVALFYDLKFYLIPKFKRMFYTVRYRSRIHCKECNVNPCNVLCEKCHNLSEYCDACYVSLQEKINSQDISLEDIKCLFCKSTLDYCQKLLN